MILENLKSGESRLRSLRTVRAYFNVHPEGIQNGYSRLQQHKNVLHRVNPEEWRQYDKR